VCANTRDRLVKCFNAACPVHRGDITVDRDLNGALNILHKALSAWLSGGQFAPVMMRGVAAAAGAAAVAGVAALLAPVAAGVAGVAPAVAPALAGAAAGVVAAAAVAPAGDDDDDDGAEDI